jgi:hypothetical protein
MLYLTDDRLAAIPGVLHGFGTKALDEKGLRELAGASDFEPALLDQIHSDVVHIIEKIPPERPPGDALVTNVPGLLLVVKTADCLPLLLFDARLRVAAAVHAGWKGTRLRIARKAVETMRSKFGTNPADMIAAAGPCIGPACYEVGEDVRSEFLSAGFSEDLFVPAGRPGKFVLDLLAANARDLAAAGVPPLPPSGTSPCTHCDPDSYSWRRDRDPSRRMFSFIGLLS